MLLKLYEGVNVDNLFTGSAKTLLRLVWEKWASKNYVTIIILLNCAIIKNLIYSRHKVVIVILIKILIHSRHKASQGSLVATRLTDN